VFRHCIKWRGRLQFNKLFTNQVQDYTAERRILLIPQILLKACVDYGDYHDFEHKVPVLSRVTFTIGSVPVDRICREKPNAVTYSSVFVVDLPCIRCIDDLRADDNSAWVRGGKPRKTYNIKCDGTGSQSHLWRVI